MGISAKVQEYILFAIFYSLVSIVMTYFLYRVFIHDLKLSPKIELMVLIYFPFTMFLGMVTWRGFRVFIYLMLPEVCSDQGRAIMVTFLLYLAFTGPLINIYKNFGVMAQILSCELQEVKSAFRELADLVSEPVVFIKSLVDDLVENAKVIFEKFSETLGEIQTYLLNTLDFISIGIDFVKRIKNVCKEEFGSPTEYCLRIVQKMVDDCEAVNDPIICTPVMGLDFLCLTLVGLNLFCMDFDLDFLQFGFVDYLEDGFKFITSSLSTLIDLNVDYEGNFDIHRNQSQSWHEMTRLVVADFVQRTKYFFWAISGAKLVIVLVSLHVVLTTFYFKYSYLVNVEYENRYLTRTFLAIDDANVKSKKSSIFPLNFRERRYYIMIYSARLTGYEFVLMMRSFVLIMIPVTQVIFIIISDYSLHYILQLIANKAKGAIEIPKVLDVKVHGDGFVASFMLALVRLFDPLINGFSLDIGKCAPNPKKPNNLRNWFIIFVCFLSIAVAISRPYTLRLKHYIMGRYYPVQARQRAVWLYNDIKRRRKSLFQIIAERTFLSATDSDTISCFQALRAKTNRFSLCRFLCGSPKEDLCINCGQYLNKKNPMSYIKCPTPACPGMYCIVCLTHLDFVCILCQNNIKAAMDATLDLIIVNQSNF